MKNIPRYYLKKIKRKKEKKKSSQLWDQARFLLPEVLHQVGLYRGEHARHSWFDPQHNRRVRWSRETGAEMKRLAGKLGCVCSGAVVTGLWYFSKDFWPRVLLIFPRGSRRCMHNRNSSCLCAILAPCVPHRHLLAGVITCSMIDVAAQQVPASFYLNSINVTLTVWAWGFFFFWHLGEEQSVHPAL